MSVPRFVQRRLIPAFVLVALGVIASASCVGAATDIDATTPADGRYQPGTATPLVVTLTADRAVEGTLSARLEGQLVGSQRVDVPGGSTKEIVLMIATDPWSSGVEVNFDAEGEADDSKTRINLTRPSGDEIVGVFPDLAARSIPETAALTVDLGDARLYPVSPDLLLNGPDALSPFSQIIATAGDIERLTDEQLQSLDGWIGSIGGILVIDGEETVDLPLSLSVDGTGSYSYGVGTIRFTGEAGTSAGYDQLFSPTAPRVSQDLPWGGFFGGIPTTTNLARDAGVRVAAIGAISIGLLVYIIVVGPVLWFVLRRLRREPGLWLAVPAVATVAALGVWFVGLQAREGAHAAHATVVADLPTSRQVYSQVLVTSTNGGTEGIELPDGWRPVANPNEGFEFGNVGVATVVAADGALRSDLGPGGIAVLGAETNMPEAPPSFAIDLRTDGDQLVGTVTNLTSYDLSESAISSGLGFASIGSIGAGETKDVTISGFDRSPFNGDPAMDQFMRGDPWTPNDGPSNPGVLINWIASRPNVRSAKFALAVGWTKDAEGPLRTDDALTVTAGRTAFVTVAPVVSTEVSLLTNQITYLQGYDTARVLDVPAGGTCTDAPLTLAITPSAVIETDNELVLAINRRAIAAFDIWNGDEWVPGEMASIVADAPTIGVPPGAFEGGSLYVRVQMTCEVWSISNPMPELRSATPDDSVIALGATEVAAPDVEAPDVEAPDVAPTDEEADPDA